MTKKKINIALAGFGNIGSYFYKILHKNKKIYISKQEKYLLLNIFLQKILIKKELLKFQNQKK